VAQISADLKRTLTSFFFRRDENPMQYGLDRTRGDKSLTLGMDWFGAGRSAPAAGYMLMTGTVVTSATIGHVAPFNGTVVAVTLSCNAYTGNLHIYANGISIWNVALVGATNYVNTAVNADFAQGDVLTFWTSANITNAQTRAFVRYRV